MQGDRRGAGHASGDRRWTFEGGEAENTTGGGVVRTRGGQHDKVSSAPPLPTYIRTHNYRPSVKKDAHEKSKIVSAEHAITA